MDSAKAESLSFEGKISDVSQMIRKAEEKLNKWQAKVELLSMTACQEIRPFEEKIPKVNAAVLKQMQELMTNISNELLAAQKLVDKVKEMQIELEQHVGTSYPNIGTLPIEIQEIIDMVFEANEKVLKLYNQLNSFANLSTSQLIEFGDEIEQLAREGRDLLRNWNKVLSALYDNCISISHRIELSRDNVSLVYDQISMARDVFNSLEVTLENIIDLVHLYVEGMKSKRH